MLYVKGVGEAFSKEKQKLLVKRHSHIYGCIAIFSLDCWFSTTAEQFDWANKMEGKIYIAVSSVGILFAYGFSSWVQCTVHRIGYPIIFSF